MTSIIYDVELWLARASEARALAKKMADPGTKRQMLVIAVEYERIARHAGEQAQLMEKFLASNEGPAPSSRGGR